ncbi:hypothetical protein CPB85DRAFT_1436664 [Mucidula mucida]|nr:hypothetical protein CPB85DRAFT_1436664 [Mucidula mucida]
MVSFKSSFTLSGLNRSNRAVAAMDTFKKHLRHKLVERLKVQFPKANLSHRPRSIVQVNNYANDTRLCDMKAQWDELRLTINWKNTFTDLFAEEDAYELHIRKTMINDNEEVPDVYEYNMAELDTSYPYGGVDELKQFIGPNAERREEQEKRSRHEIRALRTRRNVVLESAKVTRLDDMYD